jgi:uncharacterized membrane protein YkgB
MDTIVTFSRLGATHLVRFSLAVVLLWIGALKFADPAPVVELLAASFSFLAFPAFVYLLGAAEVLAGALLVAGVALPLVGLLVMGLFAGTLTIFVIAPAVSYGTTGFPYLTLPGEFLLKDLVLFAGAFTLVGCPTSAARVRRS